jgi:hypothetical protein
MAAGIGHLRDSQKARFRRRQITHWADRRSRGRNSLEQGPTMTALAYTCCPNIYDVVGRSHGVLLANVVPARCDALHVDRTAIEGAASRAVGPLPAESGTVDAAPPCGLNSGEIVDCGCSAIPDGGGTASNFIQFDAPQRLSEHLIVDQHRNRSADGRSANIGDRWRPPRATAPDRCSAIPNRCHSGPTNLTHRADTTSTR